MRDQTASAAAYTVINLAELPSSIQRELREDAAVGGGRFGVRVVEEFYNGPAVSAVYGFYHYESSKWEDAKQELGIFPTEANDEEAARTAAEAAAAAAAERLNAKADAAVAEIAGDDTASDTSTTQNKNKR